VKPTLFRKLVRVQETLSGAEGLEIRNLVQIPLDSPTNLINQPGKLLGGLGCYSLDVSLDTCAWVIARTKHR
jgi:hypothetical protein